MKGVFVTAHHVIEHDEECKACKGTGLFSGISEGDGLAVVCNRCTGTGCHHVKIEYDDFEGRKIRPNTRQVLEVNPGVMVGEGNGFKLTDYGGMSYDDWLAGKPFERGMEMRKFTCPVWWYQSADYKLKPNWAECVGCGSLSGCEHFPGKSECWARFDRELETA